MSIFVPASSFGVANFLLNFSLVVAPFGTDEFNGQVATVNAITRLALGIPEILATSVAIWLVFRALYSRLPNVPGDKTFWDLVGLREARGVPEDDAGTP